MEKRSNRFEMNSRMNFGGGFSIPQESGCQIRDTWISMTPDKLIEVRSHPIPMERQGNQLGITNWQELAQCSNLNYTGEVSKSQDFHPNRLSSLTGGLCNWDVSLNEKNHIAGSYTQAFSTDSAGWNYNTLAGFPSIANEASMASEKHLLNRSILVENMSLNPSVHSQVNRNAASLASENSLLSGSIHGMHIPLNPNCHSQVNSNWRESNFASPFLTRHSDRSDSRAWSNSLIQTPQCGFRVPFQPNCNLNSPRIKANLDELLQNIVESSSTTIAVSFKEKNNDKGSDLGIDLNKTPRQIATKRRKHRPKVIIEGKPKTTPKPRTQNPLSKENRLGKRKYVRKNGHTPKADVAGLTKDPAVRAVAKSCRRVLNFDLEKTADESQGKFDEKSEELQHRVTLALNLNSDSQDTKLFNETDSSSGEKTVLHTGRWNGVMVENQQAGTTHKFIHSMNQMPTDYILLPEWRVPPVSPATMKNLQVEKLKGVLNNVNTRYAGTSLHSYKKGSSSECQQIHEEGSGQQAKTTHGNLERTRQPMLESSLQSMLKNVADSSEARGSKRGYSNIIERMHPRTVNMINSSLMCQERFQGPEYDSNDSYLGKDFSETHKKKKTENGPCTNICSILSCVAAAEDDSRRPKMKGGNEVNASQVTSQISQGMLNSYFESSNTPKNLNNEFSKFTSEWYSPSAVGHNFPNQQSSSENLSYGEMMGEKRSNRFTQVRDFPSQAATEKDTFLTLSPIKRAPPSVDGQGIETFCTNTSTKKQTMRHTVSNLLASSKDEVVLLELKEVHGSQQSSTRKGPSKRQKSSLSIDDVISQMKDLNLNCRSNGISGQQKNALVPYKGDGNIVPYEGFDHMKKHRSRPKVDLDPDTDRLWKLLMGKEGSESTKGTDKDKEKWWEEERNVFRGRADSFIARMHLVQGDRRFSKWKGSVVDSLIGVFLTQNVSDHLSSSAFMSLVARFPNKSAINNTTCYKEGKSLLVKEREVCILDLDENIGLCGGVSSQPDNNNQSSVTCLSLGTKRKTFVEAHNWRVEEEIISPLDLLNSCILQDDGGIHSFSNLQTDKTAMFQNKRIGQATAHKIADLNSCQQGYSSSKAYNEGNANILKARKTKVEGKKKSAFDWDGLRKQVQSTIKRERSKDSMDSLDYEALRCADVHEISNVIKERGMHNMLAERIKDFLNRLVSEHGSIDLEWLRDAPPEKTKDYLLSIRGLGLKSVECVRLLTLHHLAFPVDTNVGRIAVRLGWVPLQPLPESLQLHLLELYPILESIQKYLWPRLCKLDQQTLYELHYQLITFGKVFCTKNKPNCNSCPMRGECRHFASAFASARLALPGPEEKSIVSTRLPVTAERNPAGKFTPMLLPASGKGPVGEARSETGKSEPIIEVPATPEPECLELSERDIEDGFCEDRDEIPIIEVNFGELVLNIRNCMRQNNLEVEDANISKALVALTPEAASIPTAKLKNVSRLRTEHEVYELPDSHPLLKGLERREPDDPSPYLLAIWTPGETANSTQPPERCCESHESNKLCNKETCFSCNSIREANSQIVRGTLLIPCRTAMKGSFPLNGTYFQVNEVFADHDSSQNPIEVPRAWIWNLNRRTVFFGSSVSAIFRGLSTEAIQSCFWRGFICVRGFERTTGAPRPLLARLHLSASKRPSRTRNQRRP